MVALITSVFGAAIPCRRAARLGFAQRQLFLSGTSPHLPYYHQSGMDAQAHGQVHPRWRDCVGAGQQPVPQPPALPAPGGS